MASSVIILKMLEFTPHLSSEDFTNWSSSHSFHQEVLSPQSLCALNVWVPRSFRDRIILYFSQWENQSPEISSDLLRVTWLFRDQTPDSQSFIFYIIVSWLARGENCTFTHPVNNYGLLRLHIGHYVRFSSYVGGGVEIWIMHGF